MELFNFKLDSYLERIYRVEGFVALNTDARVAVALGLAYGPVLILVTSQTFR